MTQGIETIAIVLATRQPNKLDEHQRRFCIMTCRLIAGLMKMPAHGGNRARAFVTTHQAMTIRFYQESHDACSG